MNLTVGIAVALTLASARATAPVSTMATVALTLNVSSLKSHKTKVDTVAKTCMNELHLHRYNNLIK